MKKVLSISLGSATRNTRVQESFFGEAVIIERIGTDGDKNRACQLLKQNDGLVDAFGLGGTDLYIYAGDQRHTIAESKNIAKCAQKTPLVDGSGLKGTLERNIAALLKQDYGVDLAGKKVLMVCAVDRFGMAESLAAYGCKVTYGDIVYGLGLNYPIYSLQTLFRLAKIVVPIITKLPIKYFYPIGEKQNEQVIRYPQYFRDNEVIAGDFHMIRRFMPPDMAGKIIITNSVTAEDRNLLRTSGVKLLVTTTPKMQGRSFGTNVLEALLVAMGANSPKDYKIFLEKLDIKPCVEYL